LPESKIRKSVDDKRKRTETAKAAASSRPSARKTTGGSASTPRKAGSDSAARTAKRVSRRIEVENRPQGRRWVLPAAIVLAVLGVAWGVAYFVNDKLIPGEHALGKWNILIGAGAVLVAAVLYIALRPGTGTPYAAGSRRWVPPTFIGVGLLGVAWLIVYYVAGSSIPFMAPLGNWNILIGMGGMAAAFVIATLWK